MTTTEAALRDALILARRTLAFQPHPLTATAADDKRHVLAKIDAALSQPSPASSTAGEVRSISVAEEWDAYMTDAVSKAPEPLRQLGEYLAGLLDEDKWKVAERYLNAAALSPSSGEPASVAAAVERGTVERMAYGYELMFRAICNIAGTSGERESWYRQQANEMLERVVPLHSLRADSNPHKPGDCLTQYKRFGAAVEQESLEHFAIRVEKLLCEKLGREWTATGISIASLVDELSALSKPTPVEAASATSSYGKEPCPCGHPRCKKFFLTGIGSFIQGSGFTEEEADLILTALRQEEKASRRETR